MRERERPRSREEIEASLEETRKEFGRVTRDVADYYLGEGPSMMRDDLLELERREREFRDRINELEGELKKAA